MGRAGIEPATHGFSGHSPSNDKISSADNLTNFIACSAALALQLTSDLREIIESWSGLSAADRAAVLAFVRRLPWSCS